MKASFHIADWEVQPQVNCLKRADKSYHVEPKVMQVLVELASHSTEVLSKEQLIHAVWSDTFVSDDVLTRCISEIRRVLDDDARSPKFIQTIPKTGYRLLVPVIYENSSPSHKNGDASATHLGGVQTGPVRTPISRFVTFGVLIFAVVALGLTMARFWLRPSTTVLPTNYTIIPFTSYPGAQVQPAFSPDGNQVAFVWNGDKAGNQAIYVKMIGTETPLRLTNDLANDYSPAWSPDGRSVAFLRNSDTDRGIYLVPALGGAVRKIFTPTGKIEWNRATLSWSPSGKQLIFPDGKSSVSPSAIYALDLDSGSTKQITRPPKFWDGDASPAFSPDGTKIAFARGIEGWVRDVYVVNASGGEPTRLTFDDRMVSSLTWTNDSSAVVFSSNRAGTFSLWRISAGGGTPERLPVGSDDASDPSIARRGNQLVYTHKTSTWSIRQINLHSPKIPTTLWSSAQEDSAPQYSPDASRIAFQSWRSGTQEIWVSSGDGSSPVKLTSFEKSLTGSPSWSPDGAQLVFDARPEAHSHIYSIRLDGGAPHPLTEGDYNDIVPSWSHDGRWIYFGSNRSGSWQIWKVPAAGGTPEQVTRSGGFVGRESDDGQWLYFAKSDAPGIFRIPVAGGDEQRILDQPRIGYWGYWALTGNSIFFLDQSTSPASIASAGLGGERRQKLVSLEHNPPPYAGLSVASDQSYLLYSDQVEADSHITLVKGFR